MGVDARAQMRTANTGRFGGFLWGLGLVVCDLGVAWLCGLIFRLVWAFRGVGLALVWVLVALCLVWRLNGSECLRVASVVIWGVDGVRGRRGEGYTHPYFVRAFYFALLPLSTQRKILNGVDKSGVGVLQ